MFTLVKFIEEGTQVSEDGPMTYPIEVISDSWILENRKSCLFPPRNVNFERAVRSHLTPNEKWSECNILVICSKGKPFLCHKS